MAVSAGALIGGLLLASPASGHESHSSCGDGAAPSSFPRLSLVTRARRLRLRLAPEPWPRASPPRTLRCVSRSPERVDATESRSPRAERPDGSNQALIVEASSPGAFVAVYVLDAALFLTAIAVLAAVRPVPPDALDGPGPAPPWATGTSSTTRRSCGSGPSPCWLSQSATASTTPSSPATPTGPVASPRRG